MRVTVVTGMRFDPAVGGVVSLKDEIKGAQNGIAFAVAMRSVHRVGGGGE